MWSQINKVNELEQFSRNDFFEIKNENLLKILENIWALMNFTINVDKVEFIAFKLVTQNIECK